MKRNCFITLIIFLIFSNSFVSCVEGIENEKNNIERIKKYLRINLPNGVSSFNSAFGCLDHSYEKPCIFFVSFSISKKNFNNWVKEVKIQAGNDSLLNISNKDQQIINILTSTELRDFAKPYSYKWWKPSECNNPTLYAYLYDSHSKKIVGSFKDYWDGRVLIMYCEEKSICYFIIETFL
jgi:hypothetical protein